MPGLTVLAVLVIGLFLGGLIGSRLARNDSPAMIGWVAAGAIPGAALIVQQPAYILSLVPVLPLLGLRYRVTSRRRAL